MEWGLGRTSWGPPGASRLPTLPFENAALFTCHRRRGIAAPGPVRRGRRRGGKKIATALEPMRTLNVFLVS